MTAVPMPSWFRDAVHAARHQHRARMASGVSRGAFVAPNGTAQAPPAQSDLTTPEKSAQR